jgi:hypothetical protein
VPIIGDKADVKAKKEGFYQAGFSPASQDLIREIGVNVIFYRFCKSAITLNNFICLVCGHTGNWLQTE